MTSTNSKNVFRRPSAWYRIVGWCCFGFGGWVLITNVELTVLGLVAEEWPQSFIQPIAWGIAAVEAAVSIFLTQPENWDDLWAGVEGIATDRNSDSSLPGWVGLILAGVFITLVLGMTGGAYLFDFFSTHQGLNGLDTPITWKTALFTLGYNWGTELLCFFGWQSLRMGKLASRDQLQERLEIEPEIILREQLLEHRKALAKRAAKQQIDDERQQWGQQ